MGETIQIFVRILIMTLVCLIACSTSFAGAGQAPSLLAVGFQAEGYVICEYIKQDGTPGTVSNWFRVTAEGCKSRITTGTIRDPAIEFFEYCFDGKNSSLLINYAANPAVQVANEATLMLNSGPVPEYGYGMISEVWLSYASACFYQRSAKGRSAPVFDMGSGFRESHQMVKSDWKLTRSAPTLLDYMSDFSDGFQYSEQQGSLLKAKRPSPFDQGYTNATYSVLQWTNVGSLTFPYEWQVVHYEPNTATGRLEPIAIHGYTTSIDTEGYAQDFALHIPKNTRVIDNTLEAQGFPIRSYAYITTNGQLRTAAQMAQEEDFAWALQDAQKAQPPPSRWKLIAFVVFILILFPLIFFIRKGRRGRLS